MQIQALYKNAHGYIKSGVLMALGVVLFFLFSIWISGCGNSNQTEQSLQSIQLAFQKLSSEETRLNNNAKRIDSVKVELIENKTTAILTEETMRRIASDTAAMAQYTNLIDEFENLQSTYNAMRKNYTIQLLALKVWYGKAAKELQQGNSAQDVTAVGREWEAHRKEFDLLLEVDRDLMQRLTDWEKQYNTMLADFAKKYS